MIKIDIHQHLWTEPLVQALAERRELPFVRREHGLTVLFLAIDGPPRERTCAVGDTFHFSPGDIHRVRHAGSDPAVTLHVYSPPLESMGAYAVNDDGVLVRHPMSSAEELRPLDRAD
jgi:Cysteine dioxygenase type I